VSDTLFDPSAGEPPRTRTGVPAEQAPLAVRLRPRALGELVGQQHLLAEGSALRRALEEGHAHSMVLYGPPGTGKTLLAKAVAYESGANFYSASASSFVEMFAGLGASRIRKLFDEARKNAPAIIFIDELDAVGATRSGHGFNREQDQTLNQLLVELDGFEGAEQVVVMGASNRIQDLDPALLRPGRFDRSMLVPPPDLAGREAILKVHTRGKPLNLGDVDLAQVARQTSGLTGAELANVCNEAAIKAGRRSASAITQSDFDWALERVVAGLQQRKMLTEKERRILAYHEGGHALMAHLMVVHLGYHSDIMAERGKVDRNLRLTRAMFEADQLLVGSRGVKRTA